MHEMNQNAIDQLDISYSKPIDDYSSCGFVYNPLINKINASFYNGIKNVRGCFDFKSNVPVTTVAYNMHYVF